MSTYLNLRCEVSGLADSAAIPFGIVSGYEAGIRGWLRLTPDQPPAAGAGHGFAISRSPSTENSEEPISLVKGRNVLNFEIQQENGRRVAIKQFTLTPVK